MANNLRRIRDKVGMDLWYFKILFCKILVRKRSLVIRDFAIFLPKESDWRRLDTLTKARNARSANSKCQIQVLA